MRCTVKLPLCNFWQVFRGAKKIIMGNDAEAAGAPALPHQGLGLAERTAYLLEGAVLRSPNTWHDSASQALSGHLLFST